jgi:hypothetical protein
MSKDWDYAKHSLEVSQAGGVDAWVKTIKENAYKQGGDDMKNKLVFPLLMTGTVIGTTGCYVYQKIKPKITAKRESKKILASKAEKAENLLKKELETTTMYSEPACECK